LRQGQTVRQALAGAGLAEVVTYAFTDPARAELLRRAVDPKPVELMNPLAQDASLLRVNPLEGVLSAVATNVRRQQADVRVFEVGKTYRWGNGDTGTTEPRWVAIALTGGRSAPGWAGAPEPVDVYDAKGLAEHTLDALAVGASTGEAGTLSGFEPDCHGTLVAESGAIVAEFGEVAAAVRESFGIPTPVFAAVVSLDAVGAPAAAPTRYQALPRFPAVERDLAFVIGGEHTLTAARIESALREEAGPLLRRLVLFDVFRFPDGRTSLAWRLLFQAEDRTLTDAEVNAIQERVVRRITETFHITLRSG
jgi:phenylalanyl-tRNA synthetase beta chain